MIILTSNLVSFESLVSTTYFQYLYVKDQSVYAGSEMIAWALCQEKFCSCTSHTVSHFSYTPRIKCKITWKRNMVFLFLDYQRKAH